MCVPGNRLYDSGRCVLEGVFQVVLQVTEEPSCTSFHHVEETSPVAGLHVWRWGTCKGTTEVEVSYTLCSLSSSLKHRHSGADAPASDAHSQNLLTQGSSRAAGPQRPSQAPCCPRHRKLAGLSLLASGACWALEIWLAELRCVVWNTQ